MTAEKKLKAKIRERMAATGERYTTARAAVLAAQLIINRAEDTTDLTDTLAIPPGDAVGQVVVTESVEYLEDDDG